MRPQGRAPLEPRGEASGGAGLDRRPGSRWRNKCLLWEPRRGGSGGPGTPGQASRQVLQGAGPTGNHAPDLMEGGGATKSSQLRLSPPPTLTSGP